jgi:hypothetical protein
LNFHVKQLRRRAFLGDEVRHEASEYRPSLFNWVLASVTLPYHLKGNLDDRLLLLAPLGLPTTKLEVDQQGQWSVSSATATDGNCGINF